MQHIQIQGVTVIAIHRQYAAHTDIALLIISLQIPIRIPSSDSPSRQSFLLCTMFQYTGFHRFPMTTPEQAEKNARELLDQEEQDKDKANKKRMKKKKQRERKRQQKLGESSRDMEDSTGDPDENRSEASNTDSIDLESINGELSETDGEENLDLKSTFLQHVQKKVENKTPPETSERTKQNSHERRTTKPHEAVFMDAEGSFPETPSKETNDVGQDPIQRSFDLAKSGSDLAEKEHFAEAIEHYTEAINLNPTEFRFLGNRSYIFERYGKYAEALKDAEDALSLHPGFIKGHFRKGKAMKGLQKYPEAIEAFLTIWESDGCHTEAAAEVAQCKVKMQDLAVSRDVHSNPIVGPDHTPNGFMGGNLRPFLSKKNLRGTGLQSAILHRRLCSAECTNCAQRGGHTSRGRSFRSRVHSCDPSLSRKPSP
uniref:Uncharacterized protein n=1 Tax=Leptobrachium leishanense TaxID=445787 RepID=A0A8C5M7M3_9ANUR